MQKLAAIVDFSESTPAVLKAANAMALAFDMKRETIAAAFAPRT
jgi:hypothetical protein